MQPATTSSQALNNLQNFAGSIQTPDQDLQKEEQNLGTTAAQQQVSGLQSAINNTTNLLNNVAPSVMGRTGNSLVTAAQANAQITNAQTPLEQNLSNQEQDYSSANSNYQNLMGQAEDLANADQSSQQNEEGYLQNIYGSLYGQEQQNAANTQNESQFQQQLAESEREANLEYGQTNTAPTISTNNLQNNLLQGITDKGSTGASGYAFTGSGGKPISAASWASENNTNIANVLYSMSQSGDKGAQAAYSAIEKNGGKITNQIKNQYADIFWGS